jgi:hypothetical protein
MKSFKKFFLNQKKRQEKYEDATSNIKNKEFTPTSVLIGILKKAKFQTNKDRNKIEKILPKPQAESLK